MVDSDGIILGSPVYSACVTSQMKTLIDRASMVLSGNRELFKYKVGASVVAARRGGAISAFDTLNHFLHSKEIFLVGSITGIWFTGMLSEKLNMIEKALKICKILDKIWLGDLIKSTAAEII